MYGVDAPIKCRTSNLPTAGEDTNINLRRTAKNDGTIIVIDGVEKNRSELVKSLLPERLYTKAPGMNPRKEVELFTKWRPLVPMEFQDITCPRPSDEIMAMVKNEIYEKRKGKEAKKMSSKPTTKKRKKPEKC